MNRAPPLLYACECRIAGTAVESEREALKQIAEAAKSAQEAALEAFRASVRAVEQATEGKTPARPGR